MSGRRRPRAQKRAGRAGKPRTLRTRLVVASVVLIAVICSVIGTVTTLALRTHLYDQLGDQVFDAGKRLAGPPFGRDNDPNSAALDQLDKFVSYGPTQEDTVVAKVGADGTISKALIAKHDAQETRQQSA